MHASDAESVGLLLHLLPPHTRTGQGVDVSCSVTDDQQVVVVCGLEALTTQAQGSSTHALQLGVGAQRSRDEGVLWRGGCRSAEGKVEKQQQEARTTKAAVRPERCWPQTAWNRCCSGMEGISTSCNISIGRPEVQAPVLACINPG
jgi:hypothetical protein